MCIGHESALNEIDMYVESYLLYCFFKVKTFRYFWVLYTYRLKIPVLELFFITYFTRINSIYHIILICLEWKFGGFFFLNRDIAVNFPGVTIFYLFIFSTKITAGILFVLYILLLLLLRRRCGQLGF